MTNRVANLTRQSGNLLSPAPLVVPNPLVLGSVGGTSGELELVGSTSGNVDFKVSATGQLTITLTGSNTILFVDAGAVTLSCTSGLNLGGSGGSSIALQSGSTMTAMQIKGFATNLTTQTGATYTTSNSDDVILSNPAGAQTVTLTTTGILIGKRFTVRNITAAQTITVKGAAGNIDGVASVTLTTGQKATYAWDGTNWWSIA